MNDSFYRQFEDRHRGAFEQIQERLRVYLPFLEPLKALHPDARAIDLGCGRGEWVALLRDAGFRSEGVDLDEAMLSAARERGLPVHAGDAIAWLAALPDASMSVVSAFHLVEHLPFDSVRAILREGLRVLKPGGMLVMETPNCENLVVATSEFYMDPTHGHPVPPGLLVSLSEYHGFRRAKLLRLQEPEWLMQATPALISVLRDVSPDAGVVAQKDAAPEVLACFEAPFARDYGVALEALAGRYDAYVDSRFTAAHARIGDLEGRVTQALLAVQAAAAEARLAMQMANAPWRPLRSLAATISRILGRKP